MYSRRNLEAIPVSVPRRMAKEAVEKPSNGLLLTNKKEWTITTHNNIQRRTSRPSRKLKEAGHRAVETAGLDKVLGKTNLICSDRWQIYGCFWLEEE